MYNLYKTEINDKDHLVSFDVCNLFTMEPIEETIQIVGKKLEEDETLEERSHPHHNYMFFVGSPVVAYIA